MKSPKKKQESKKRSHRVPLQSPVEMKPISTTSRWTSKELKKLHIAMTLSVNPRPDDWNKIAEAISKSCNRERTAQECKLRAEKEGLLAGPSGSGSYPGSPTDNQSNQGSNKPKLSTSGPEYDEVHRKHYDDFFSKQESPLDSLELDDSLVECFGPPTQRYTRLYRSRVPFLIRPVPVVDSLSDSAEFNISG